MKTAALQRGRLRGRIHGTVLLPLHYTKAEEGLNKMKKGPVIGAIVKNSNNAIALLHVTPDGFVWEGEGPEHLMRVAEEEARRQFGSCLEKLLVFFGDWEYWYQYDKNLVTDDEYAVRVEDRRRLDNRYNCRIEDITAEHIAYMEEKWFWGRHDFRLGEDVVQLEGQKRLVRDYGKYRSGLSILVESYQDYGWKREQNLAGEMNVRFDGDTFVMRGEYFVSKKGTKCFRVHQNGPHILIKNKWGGAFNSTRGFRWGEPEDALYFRRASSNGGGMGNDYIVFPVGYRRQLREEDVI